MRAVDADQGFAYVLVSAVPLQDTAATGIGIIYKADDASTLRTHCGALDATTPLAATYEAMMRVLDQALGAGVKRFTIYVDNHSVVRQLQGDEEVPREVLGANLHTRGMLHQVGRVRLVAADSPHFSARRLAESARPPRSTSISLSPRQLTLLPEDAMA